MEISIEEAYKEACLALGESIVRERLLSNSLVTPASAPTEQQASKAKSCDEVHPDADVYHPEGHPWG